MEAANVCSACRWLAHEHPIALPTSQGLLCWRDSVCHPWDLTACEHTEGFEYEVLMAEAQETLPSFDLRGMSAPALSSLLALYAVDGHRHEHDVHWFTAAHPFWAWTSFLVHVPQRMVYPLVEWSHQRSPLRTARTLVVIHQKDRLSTVGEHAQQWLRFVVKWYLSHPGWPAARVAPLVTDLSRSDTDWSTFCLEKFPARTGKLMRYVAPRVAQCMGRAVLDASLLEYEDAKDSSPPTTSLDPAEIFQYVLQQRQLLNLTKRLTNNFLDCGLVHQYLPSMHETEKLSLRAENQLRVSSLLVTDCCRACSPPDLCALHDIDIVLYQVGGWEALNLQAVLPHLLVEGCHGRLRSVCYLWEQGVELTGGVAIDHGPMSRAVACQYMMHVLTLMRVRCLESFATCEETKEEEPLTDKELTYQRAEAAGLAEAALLVVRASLPAAHFIVKPMVQSKADLNFLVSYFDTPVGRLRPMVLSVAGDVWVLEWLWFPCGYQMLVAVSKHVGVVLPPLPES